MTGNLLGCCGSRPGMLLNIPCTQHRPTKKSPAQLSMLLRLGNLSESGNSRSTAVSLSPLRPAPRTERGPEQAPPWRHFPEWPRRELLFRTQEVNWLVCSQHHHLTLPQSQKARTHFQLSLSCPSRVHRDTLSLLRGSYLPPPSLSFQPGSYRRWQDPTAAGQEVVQRKQVGPPPPLQREAPRPFLSGLPGIHTQEFGWTCLPVGSRR